MRKLRAYIAPTRSNPNRAILGIPDNVQLDDSIASISIAQEAVEVAATPLAISNNPTLETNPVPVETFENPSSNLGTLKGFLDGAVQKIDNLPVSASKSIGITDLTPGLELRATPVLSGLPSLPGLPTPIRPLLPPFEIQEIVLPDGFVPMEDMSMFELYKYNRANIATDSKFESLPGSRRAPKNYHYDLIYVEDYFTWETDTPDLVTSIGVYWRRKSKLAQDYEWTYLGELSKDVEFLEWDLTGEYVFRAAPMHYGNPLDGFKEYEIDFPEPEGLFWTYCQTAPGEYNARFEGNVGTEINLVKLYENGELLKTIKLNPDATGRVELEFPLKNVSLDDSPEIKLNFFQTVDDGGEVFFFSETLELEKNYAVEPISMRVQLIKRRAPDGGIKNVFDVNIVDRRNMMYQPKTAIEPFSGTEWVTAIQRKKMMVLLEINRIQDGLKTEYGQFYVNISQEKDPNFLQSPPFNDNVRRIERGFKFEFEDTEEFRKILELDAPDLDKRLAYEFRLVFWSAGIDEALRNDAEYIYVKQVPINVNNKKGFYKYAYNTWKNEHPQAKYKNIIPAGIEHKDLDKHLEYGRSAFATVLSADPLPRKRTTNIIVEPKGWKVLYFPDDKDDTVKEIPYYQFLIGLPATTQDHVHSVKVFVGKDNKRQIGTYHPCDTLNIVDFFGHYKYRNEISSKLDFRGVIKPEKEVRPSRGLIDKLPSFDKSSMTGRAAIDTASTSMLAEPAKQVSKTSKKSFSKLAQSMNRAVSRKMRGNSFIEYEIVVEFSNGQITKTTHYAELSNIPQIPEEPDDNVSFSLGNPTIARDFIDNALVPSLNTSVIDAIESFELPKATSIPIAATLPALDTGTLDTVQQTFDTSAIGANLGTSPAAVPAVATNNQPNQNVVPEAEEALEAIVAGATNAARTIMSWFR